MKRTLSLLATSASLLVAPSARADDAPVPGPFIGTHGYASPETRSLIELDTHIIKGEGFVGVVPELVLQLGNRTWAGGALLGFAHASPERGAASSGIGNVTLFVKGKTCAGQEASSTCVGVELDGSVAPKADADAIGALAVGLLDQLRADRFGNAVLVLSPQLLLSTRAGVFFAQAHVGPQLATPTSGSGREAVTFLTFAGLVGVADTLGDLGVGARGLAVLSGNEQALGSIDVVAHVNAGAVTPTLMVSAPLDADRQRVMGATVSAGLQGSF